MLLYKIFDVKIFLSHVGFPILSRLGEYRLQSSDDMFSHDRNFQLSKISKLGSKEGNITRWLSSLEAGV